MDTHQTTISTKTVCQCYHDRRPKSATAVPPLPGKTATYKP